MDVRMMNKVTGKEYENNINSNQVDHRTAKNIDERTMVDGLEFELLQSMRRVSDRKSGSIETTIEILSALIDAKIKLDRVQTSVIENITIEPGWSVKESEGNGSIVESIYSSIDLVDLPTFLPLTGFTPDQFAEIRNGDRFNVDGRTMHVRFEKKYIPGLRSLKVIKGSD